MSPVRTGTPEQRLEAIERDMRRVRRLSGFVIVALAVLLGVAGAIIAMAERGRLLDRSHDLVESKRFLLRDESGRIRGLWEATDSGAAQIILSDSAGRERLRLRVLEDGSAGLAMVDSLQRSRAVLAVLPDETTALALADGSGRTRAVLGLQPGGAPSLALADPDGTVRTGLGLEGGPGVTRGRPVEPPEPREPEPDTTQTVPSDERR
ncbi:MAG TPA: hypothetical protein VG500_19615 [Gemmatimonadales bacterium]|nr:hypothetical protein [Gemmatimonadales bacterium]